MKHYDVVLARAKEFSIERNEPVMIAKAKNKNDYVILLNRKPTKNYEIVETINEVLNIEVK